MALRRRILTFSPFPVFTSFRAEAPFAPAAFPQSKIANLKSKILLIPPDSLTPGWTYAVHVIFSFSASKGQKSPGRRGFKRRRRDISIELPAPKYPAPYGASSSGAQFLLPAGLQWRSLTTITEKLAI
jgi:hypothetical protein